jgi:RNA polymerase sigma factor (sigma-70 family)
MSPSISARLLRTQSDERLAAAAAQGHERAFEALVVRYRKPLIRYARRLGLGEARGEDVVQQALMRAWVSLQGGAEVRDVSAWLYRIVHNAAVDALRGPCEGYEQLGDAAGDVAATRANPESAVAVRETLAGIAALPGLQREALLCTAVEGRSNEQAAAALGVTTGAVRGLVYRARVALRAGATAITPPSVLGWAVGAGRRGPGLTEQLTSAEAAGAGAGVATGILLKGGAVLLTAGAIVVSAATVRHGSPSVRRPTVAVSTADVPRGAGAGPSSVLAVDGGRHAARSGGERVGPEAVTGTGAGAGLLAVGGGGPRPSPVGTGAPTTASPRQPSPGTVETSPQEAHFNAAESGAGPTPSGAGSREAPSESKPAPGAGAEGPSKPSGTEAESGGAGGSKGSEGAHDEGESGPTGSSDDGSSDDAEPNGEHSGEASSPGSAGSGSETKTSDDRHSTEPGQVETRDN